MWLKLPSVGVTQKITGGAAAASNPPLTLLLGPASDFASAHALGYYCKTNHS